MQIKLPKWVALPSSYPKEDPSYNDLGYLKIGMSLASKIWRDHPDEVEEHLYKHYGIPVKEEYLDMFLYPCSPTILIDNVAISIVSDRKNSYYLRMVNHNGIATISNYRYVKWPEGKYGSIFKNKHGCEDFPVIFEMYLERNKDSVVYYITTTDIENICKWFMLEF